MRLMCQPCQQERDFKQKGAPVWVDGGWWQVWMCLCCGGKRTIIRPELPGQQAGVR